MSLCVISWCELGRYTKNDSSVRVDNWPYRVLFSRESNTGWHIIILLKVWKSKQRIRTRFDNWPYHVLFSRKWNTGGIIILSQRYGRANNNYHDPQVPSSFLICLDAKKPVRVDNEWTLGHWRFHMAEWHGSIADNADISFVLEVISSMVYIYMNFTMIILSQLSPSKWRTVCCLTTVSPCSSKTFDKPCHGTPKLIPSPNDKRYIAHYRNLKLYYARSLVLEKSRRY